MWKALNCLNYSGCEGEQWKRSLERGPDPTAAGGDREPSSTALTQNLVGLFVWSRGSLLGLFSALLCISWAWSRTGVMLSWEPSPGLGAAAMISSQWFFQVGRAGCVTWFQHPWEAAPWNLLFHPLFFHFILQVKSRLEPQLKANGRRQEAQTGRGGHLPKSSQSFQQRVRKGWSIAGGTDNSSKCCI